jgi:hypothetical protein
MKFEETLNVNVYSQDLMEMGEEMYQERLELMEIMVAEMAEIMEKDELK